MSVFVKEKSENIKELRKIIDFYSNLYSKSELNTSLLSFLMDTINGSIWQWNIKTNEVKLSKNFKNTANLDKDIYNIDDFLSLVHPDDLELMKQKLVKYVIMNSGKNILENYSVYEFTYRVLRSDGLYINVMDRGKIISWDDEGSPLIMVGINLNV